MARYWYAIGLAYAGAISEDDVLLRFKSKKRRDEYVDSSWDDERMRYRADDVTREYAEYAFPDAFGKRVIGFPWFPSCVIDEVECASCQRRIN